jgi:serine/threonine protein kinase
MVPGEQQLGRYRLLKLIAKGGMGEIYLAEDPSINRQVAIKVIRSEIAPLTGEGGSSDNARLFEREARAIAMLDHPYILPLYDYGEQKQGGTVLTYLVMPYRPEGSLATWLEQRPQGHPLPLEDCASIIIQAASALQYTHDHQIIHQDVKPSNFLIRLNREHPERPDIQISDFGIARLSNMTSGASQNIRGTPGYMSPEQWEGSPVPASDQYALAAMAYELVTGSQPFKGNPMQMMYAHVNTPPQVPSSLVPGLPPALDAVLLRGLAKRPANRFPTIQAFAQAFQQAVLSASAAPVQQPNFYAAAQAGSSASGPGVSDLYATLAISEAEAFSGSERLLTLPDGTQIPVSIPAGARHGQILELSSANTTGVGATPNIVRLKLSVRTTHQGGSASAFAQQQSMPALDSLTSISGPTAGSSNSALGGTASPTVATRRQGGVIPSSPVPGPATPVSPSRTTLPYGTAETPSYARATPAQPFPTQASSFANAQPYAGPMSASSPGLPSKRPPRNPRGLLVAVVAVALLLILSGGVLVYALSGGPILGGGGGGTPGTTATSSTNVYATQTALVNAGQNAQSTATANATGTAQGTANTQGTASAQASATAQAQANATGTASATNPYGGTLALNDPMADNSQGHNWDVISDATVGGSSCGFTDGAYHMVMPVNYGGACLGEATSFSNFAFQVHMEFFQTGQHFSGGGLVFRGAAGSQYYVLEIFESGAYSFFSCSGNDCSHGIAGYPNAKPIPSFQTGLNQTNTITVVAQGTTFTLYANGQQFGQQLTDSTYSSGLIGFYAEGGSEGGATATTDVAYSNVKVWQF